MESFFPELFFLSFFAPLIIRVAVALVFFFDARQLWGVETKSKTSSISLVILGLLIGVGAFTQLAVIVAAGHVLYLSATSERSVFKNKLLTFLSLSILWSLLLTGSGGLAFDLPY